MKMTASASVAGAVRLLSSRYIILFPEAHAAKSPQHTYLIKFLYFFIIQTVGSYTALPFPLCIDPVPQSVTSIT